MPFLIKNIVVSMVENVDGRISKFDNIIYGIAKVKENYIWLGSYEGFLFDYSNVTSIEQLSTPINHGLIVNTNKTFIDIEISY